MPTETRSISAFQSGRWEQQYQYRSFIPEPVNFNWLVDDAGIQALLSEADHKLGQLDAYGTLVPNIDFFIQMYAAKEATESNRIEGTITEITEAVMLEQDIDPERLDDWAEVQNYIQAMHFAIGRLEEIPLSSRLLRETHAVLLQGVRGTHKQPGNFRNSQNWIGGASLKDAVFIPPQQQQVPELMSDLEKFLHNPEISTPHLIKAAIAHYQFETIHPFLDGNGRLGRLLITLYLVSNRLLSRPSLYLSDFISRNKTLYYDNLTKAREKNDLNQWLRFFLVGISQTADDATDTFRRILSLKTHIETERLPKMGKRIPLARRFLELLYQRPVVSAQQVAQMLAVTPATANRLIAQFTELGILREKTGFRRNRLFEFGEYLRLFG
ncbi:MAG: Fic family protein [Saprospiraceae bacterium]